MFFSRYNLQGKVVVITGASSGIGAACAKEFAERGCRVVLAARDSVRLKDLEYYLQSYGHEAIAVRTDVEKEADCSFLINKAVEKFGTVDVLINNAGLSMRALFEEVNLDVLRKLMNVNFWGTVYCTKYALPYLTENQGSVVGVTSIAGFHGLPARTGYSASKFAMHGFLETIRIENLKNGLHVMITAPGFTASNVRKSALGANGEKQGDSPRDESKMMTAADVAKIIADGIVRRKRNVIMSWEGMITVFLQRIVPRALDRLFYHHMAKEPDSPLK
jgi:short-subunit dehydrogenase